MPATILDGNKLAAQIKQEVAQQVRDVATANLTPGLAAVLVGNNLASEIYVSGKVKAAAETGIHSEKVTPPETITTAELLRVIEELNERDDIDGILVQL